MAKPDELNPFESPIEIDPKSGIDHEGFLRFYIRIWPYFAAMAILTALIDIVVVAIAFWPWRSNELLDAVSLYVGMFMLTATFHGLLSAFLKQYYPVYVSDEGIRCFDFWGKYRYVEWPAITQVRPISMIGLGYLRLFDEVKERPIWLPLFISNSNEFWNQVQEFAPNSPVARWRLTTVSPEA